LHQHLPDIVHIPAGRKFVEKVVAEQASPGDEFTEQPRVRACLEPMDLFERAVRLRKGLCHGQELARNLAVGTGE
jgi:hypothetical protein